MPAGDVVDQVGERLRDGRAGVLGEEPLQVDGGAAGVQGAADRVGGEAVDGRAALGLDVGAEGEGLCERGEQRAGRDRGEVGLQDDVVEGFGQQRGEDGRRVGAVEQGAGGGGERAAAGDAEQFGLVQGPLGEPVAQLVAVGPGGAAAQRAVPAQRGQQGVRAGGGAGGQLGEPGEGGAADGRGQGAVEFRPEGGARPALAVGGAGEPADAGGGEPGAGEQRPAVGGVLLPPLVVRGGRRPHFVDLAVGGDQPRGVREFEPERGVGLGALQQRGGALEVADAEAAGPQGGRRGDAPGLQQLFEDADGGGGLPGGGAVDHGRVASDDGFHGGRGGLDGAVGAAAAQVQGEFAGQHHRGRAGRQQQAAGQQPLDGAVRVRGGHLPGGVRDGAGRRPPDQALQQAGGGGRCLVEQRGQPLAVAEQRGERGDGGDRVGGGRQPGAGQQLLEAGGRHADGGLGQGRAEAGAAGVERAGGERLADGEDQAQRRVRPPDQGLFAQPGERGRESGGDGGPVDRVGAGVRLDPGGPGQQVADHGVGRALGRGGQRLGGLQREAVQPFQGTQHGRPTGEPGGQLGEVGGHRVQQVGAGPEQRGDSLVLPAAEFLGQRPGGACAGGARRALRCGHPLQISQHPGRGPER